MVANRVSALAAGVLIATAAGTPYVFAVFAPQLVHRTGLSADQAAKLSLALSLGGSLGGLPAGALIDSLGPQKATALGGVLTAVAYTVLRGCYVAGAGSLALLMLCLAVVGFASILSFYSTIKCTTANWPDHRGSAGALPVAAYALASLIYSYVAVLFFTGDTPGLLQFFSIAGPAVCIVCAYWLRINEHKPTNATETDILLPSSETIPPRKSSMKHIFSLWGSARTSSTLSFDQMRPVVRPPKHHRADSDALYIAVEDTPVFVRDGSPFWDHHITKAIRSRVFLKFYVILGCMMAMGQLYIYSVGYIVVILKEADTHSRMSVGDAQALQVSTVAIASFLGRLTSGPISDMVRRKLKAQRVWCVAIAACIMALGQYFLTVINTLDGLTIPSFIIGFAFGFVFGTFPAIIADSFGTQGFTTIWGCATTSGLLILMQLSRLFAHDLKKNGDSEGVCTLGARCYSGTFIVTQWICFAVMMFTMFTIWYNHRVASK